jgi:type I restriction enzyme S subunit
MAQAIYREWFVHFRFPGHEGVKMVISGTELGMVPDEWQVRNLSDIVTNIKETTSPSSLTDDIFYVPIDCIPRHSLALTETRPGNEAQSSLLLFRKHDILFGSMRSYFRYQKGRIFEVNFFWYNCKKWVHFRS